MAKQACYEATTHCPAPCFAGFHPDRRGLRAPGPAPGRALDPALVRRRCGRTKKARGAFCGHRSWLGAMLRSYAAAPAACFTIRSNEAETPRNDAASLQRNVSEAPQRISDAYQGRIKRAERQLHKRVEVLANDDACKCRKDAAAKERRCAGRSWRRIAATLVACLAVANMRCSATT